MSIQQSLKAPLSVNVTAKRLDGKRVDVDLDYKEFLSYMTDLNESDCIDLDHICFTFLHNRPPLSKKNFKERIGI